MAKVGFTPISPASTDDLILPPGYVYDIVIRCGDLLGSKGPQGLEFFGDDNDFIAFFPSSDHATLIVNHESVNAVHRLDGARKLTRDEWIRAEKLHVGLSKIRIEKKNGVWKYAPSKLNQRVTASYPKIEMTGPVSSEFTSVVGSLANCSGGVTPWGTALSCEENFDEYNLSVKKGGHGWADVASQAIDERHCGWVVEWDPDGTIPLKKHSALGRFAHEAASVRIGASGKVVVYLGDDGEGRCLYKFVSEKPLQEKMTRQEKSSLLHTGVLWVADFKKLEWLALDINRNPNLKANGFKSQSDILMRCREAAEGVGGTPLDRPEGSAISPTDGSLYLSLSNHKKIGNFHGQIIRVIERGDDAESLAFQFETFLVGGSESSLSCPDNITFDPKGGFWASCDISSGSISKKPYAEFENNGFFYIPLSGKGMGHAYQFASAPIGAELTGPRFTPEGDTLFLSVQHPGEGSPVDKLSSHWPDGKQSIPLSAVVSIAMK